MNWRNVVHIGLLDLKLTIRGRVSFAMVILMPILMILLMGNVMEPYFDLTEEELPYFQLAYDNDDEGTHGRAFDLFLREQSRDHFDILEVPADRMEDRIQSGDYPAGIIIPQNFTSNIEEGRGAEIVIIGSGNHPLEEGVLQGLVEGYASREEATSNEKDLSHTGLTSFQFFSGSMIIFFLLTSGMGIGSTLIEERNSRLYRRIHSFGVPRKEYLLGKILSNGVIGGMQALTILMVTTIVFDVHWGTQPIALGLLILLVIFISCAIGILFSTFMPSSGGLTASMTIVLWFMSFLSGGFTGSPILGDLGKGTINHWAFEGITALMKGKGIREIHGCYLVLGFIAVVLWSAGLYILNRRVSYE